MKLVDTTDLKSVPFGMPVQVRQWVNIVAVVFLYKSIFIKFIIFSERLKLKINPFFLLNFKNDKIESSK